MAGSPPPTPLAETETETPTTMAEADTARETAPPPHRSLPDEITIWEILVRLPPKSLLRCRAVCRAWRSATSARDFLLAHHALQPALPLLYGYNFVDDELKSLDIIPFDRRTGAGQLQPVARLEQASDFHHLEASCDGLLVLSVRKTNIYGWRFSICNPATRQYAPLPWKLDYGPNVEYSLLGMYPHIPTGNYRLLMHRASVIAHVELPPDPENGSYIFTLGSGEPPRHIGFLDAEVLPYTFGSVLFRGSLHWCPPRGMIRVFDTTTELFRQMRPPVVPPVHAKLFEMDGMLGMSGFNDAATTIDIWMAQDYESGVWACKYRVEFSVADLTVQFGKFDLSSWVVAVPWDGDVLLLVNFGEWLLQVDIHGKLVATIHRRGLGPANLRLKQTLVQHTFFPTLEGYVANSSPFI